jgi:hypothetical protein
MIDFDSAGANELERNGAAQAAAAVRRSAASALLSAIEIWSTSTSGAPAESLASTETADAAGASGQANIQEGAQATRARPSQLLAEARFFSSSASRNKDLPPAPQPAEPTVDLSVEFQRGLEEASHA